MDNGQPPTWVNAALATAKDVWQAFVVPTGLAAWAVWKMTTGRRDDARARRETREAQFIDVQRTEATELRAELAAERKRADAESAEADRWRGIARGWFDAAHDAKHDFNNLATAARVRMERANLPTLAATEMVMSRDLERPERNGGLA